MAKFTKVGRQIQDELREIPCLALSDEWVKRKSIRTSRSFKPELTEFDDIAAALSLYATRAIEKCRKQHTFFQTVTVFIHTNPFQQNQPQYRNGITVGLHQPTNDTLFGIKLARQLLKKIYKPGYKYKKAGIILDQISSNMSQQLSFFQTVETKSSLMRAMDQINERYGKDTIHSSSIQRFNALKLPQSMISPQYTTKWCDILAVS